MKFMCVCVHARAFIMCVHSSQLRKPKPCAEVDESGTIGQLEQIVSPSSDPEASPDGLLDATFEEECSASVSLSQR